MNGGDSFQADRWHQLTSPFGAYVTAIGSFPTMGLQPTSALPSGPGSLSAPTSRSQNAQPWLGMALIPPRLHLAALAWWASARKCVQCQQCWMAGVRGVKCMAIRLPVRWLSG